jgi:probable HAF family extracellular repeat protein
VVVGRAGFGYLEAFRWTQAGGMVGLGFLDPIILDSRASAVSGDGSVVVGQAHSGADPEAFRWTQTSGMVGLGFLDPNSPISQASAISFDGSVVVGEARTGDSVEAFLWTQAGGLLGLGFLDPNYPSSSQASAVSGDGSVVVGQAFGPFPEAFIWDAAHGMRNLKQVFSDQGLDMTEWGNLEPTGVSGDGLTIVGKGNHLFQKEAWIAHIPEPSSSFLCALGLSGLILLRRLRGA